MKIVLDTNVLVRATKYATGPACELLGQLQSAPHVLVISRELLVELVRVLDYRMQYLLTWNCNHLANANKFEHIQILTAQRRLLAPLLVTPEQLLEIYP